MPRAFARTGLPSCSPLGRQDAPFTAPVHDLRLRAWTVFLPATPLVCTWTGITRELFGPVLLCKWQIPTDLRTHLLVAFCTLGASTGRCPRQSTLGLHQHTRIMLFGARSKARCFCYADRCDAQKENSMILKSITQTKNASVCCVPIPGCSCEPRHRLLEGCQAPRPLQACPSPAFPFRAPVSASPVA